MTQRFCQDYGDRPGCLGTPDERYTMRFDDIGEQPILWCASCGPQAHAMDKALKEAFATRPGFAKELETAIDAVCAKRREELT